MFQRLTISNLCNPRTLDGPGFYFLLYKIIRMIVSACGTHSPALTGTLFSKVLWDLTFLSFYYFLSFSYFMNSDKMPGPYTFHCMYEWQWVNILFSQQNINFTIAIYLFPSWKCGRSWSYFTSHIANSTFWCLSFIAFMVNKLRPTVIWS